MSLSLWPISTIADIHKARWQVELCCKWSKQNLKIKRFLGTSKNAVLTQIWIAMCVYLLLSDIKFLNHIRPSLQQRLRLLQLNLFERRNLPVLLRRPTRTSHFIPSNCPAILIKVYGTAVPAVMSYASAVIPSKARLH